METSEGDIRIQLYNETPRHRDNFLRLVKEHYYDSLQFHRVIKDFMIQGGKGAHLDYTIEAEFVYPKYFHKRGALSAARKPDQANPERRSSGSQPLRKAGLWHSRTGMRFPRGSARQNRSL